MTYTKPHEHRYNPFNVKNAFEPVVQPSGETLYAMVEYIYALCNCGAGIKVLAKPGSQQDLV